MGKLREGRKFEKKNQKEDERGNEGEGGKGERKRLLVEVGNVLYLGC